MTPAARVAAAIEVLDQWIAGEGLERALTKWARGHRFAGSSDRAAIRDYCYDVARRKRSCAWLGGSDTGRGLMLGLLRGQGGAVDDVFSGVGYGPPVLTQTERSVVELNDAPDPVKYDCPDWLWPHFERFEPRRSELLGIMQSRAPLFLRANLLRTNVATAIAELAKDGVLAEPHPLSKNALKVIENPRRVQQSNPFRDGLVELQDASSQAVVDQMPLTPGQTVFDFCAGGGGKALAIAAQTQSMVVAHDANPARMNDLATRAKRAGADIKTVSQLSDVRSTFDLVVCDVPCSGSGSWRRDPEGKWKLTPETLDELNELQSNILTHAAEYVRSGGVLAYVTCSLLHQENECIVSKFAESQSGFAIEHAHQFLPFDEGDAFFVARLRNIA